MFDATQDLQKQSAAIQSLQAQLTEIKSAEETLRKDAAQALAHSLSIRQKLDALPKNVLPRETLVLQDRVQALDAQIDSALRDQVRDIFKKHPARTAEALRTEYLKADQRDPALLARLTDALVAATEALNQEEAGAANSQVQARQRWQAVYDACDGKQPALAAARKKAAGYLPPWWRRNWIVLALGALLLFGVGLTAVLFRPATSIPIIDSVDPSAFTVGDPDQDVTIKGRYFDDKEVTVTWNETPLAILNPTEDSLIVARIGSDLLSSSGEAQIRVHNSKSEPSNPYSIQVRTRPTATFTPAATPTLTPSPSATPTYTPLPIVESIECSPLLIGRGNQPEVTKLLTETVALKERAKKDIEWSEIVPIPGGCELTALKTYQYRVQPITATLSSNLVIRPVSDDLRLFTNGDAVALKVPMEIKELEHSNSGELAFSLEVKVKNNDQDEWRKVEPVKLILKWNITAAQATPKVTPRPPVTATPRPRPANTTATVTYPPPTLMEPADNAEAKNTVKFVWTYPSPTVLGTYDGFEIRIWKVGATEHLGAAEVVSGAWEKSINIGDAQAVKDGCSGDYWWTVAVVRVENGNYQRIGEEASPRKLKVMVDCSRATEVPPS